MLSRVFEVMGSVGAREARLRLPVLVRDPVELHGFHFSTIIHVHNSVMTHENTIQSP